MTKNYSSKNVLNTSLIVPAKWVPPTSIELVRDDETLEIHYAYLIGKDSSGKFGRLKRIIDGKVWWLCAFIGSVD